MVYFGTDLPVSASETCGVIGIAIAGVSLSAFAQGTLEITGGSLALGSTILAFVFADDPRWMSQAVIVVTAIAVMSPLIVWAPRSARARTHLENWAPSLITVWLVVLLTLLGGYPPFR
ncbi:hypothetical protein JOE58_002521 [Curtobacterium luteum]|uniref:Uncharacterized protein n=1 Tax=Curtobacterium luteum TaxID=33881 RepID=A0ABS2RW76_9MICO|nr:hypothetical protein [Curtobacterium luteum]MBM7803270.1 hypothetical protein [Curtobacterium luteum]NUU50916.1 hypothetical protein [Curtobacterium luteum]